MTDTLAIGRGAYGSPRASEPTNGGTEPAGPEPAPVGPTTPVDNDGNDTDAPPDLTSGR